MRIKYERRMATVGTCPNCGVELMGNGSSESPYQCECGVWRSECVEPMEYEIKKKATVHLVTCERCGKENCTGHLVL